MITGVDPIYEMDFDGDLGSLMGWLLYGDVDHDDIETFMGDHEVTEGFPEGTEYGFEIKRCWVRKVPIPGGGSRYVYTNTAGPGARACVRIEVVSFWGYWCWRHHYEPAVTGVPISRFSNPPMPFVRNGFLYLCDDCARDHSARYEAARKDALAKVRAEQGGGDR